MLIATVLPLGPVDVTQIAANFVSNKADVIIRMRGLPFNTKETEVVSSIILTIPVNKSGCSSR